LYWSARPSPTREAPRGTLTPALATLRAQGSKMTSGAQFPLWQGHHEPCQGIDRTG